MKFIDRAKIFVKSGAGGNGKVSFRREKFIPYGGPDGGDGGNGGSIVFYVDPNKDTLIDFTKKMHFKASPGECGKSCNAYGKSANDLVIHIPLGTQIYDEEKKLLLFDADKVNEKFVLFKGGSGGIGNTKFATSTNRAPKYAKPGGPSQEAWVNLILKVFCDYGYVGFPNAGKSSLLKVLTGSSTKIGNYPFTTLNPQLGTLWNEDKRIVMADLPGIIQGAHENKGLGFRFLGHVERCKGIFHIIDISALNSLEYLKTMLYEIASFSELLLEKKQIVILNKIDLVSSEDVDMEISKIKNEFNFEVIPISAEKKVGLEKITSLLFSS